MKKVKQIKGWGIYENNKREVEEHGFSHTVIHPDNMGCGLLSPQDSDIECESLEAALSWVKNYA